MSPDQLNEDPFSLSAVQDASISEVAQAEILRAMALENPAWHLDPFASKSHGIEQEFGPRFACIDEIATELHLPKISDRAGLCTALTAIYLAN